MQIKQTKVRSFALVLWFGFGIFFPNSLHLLAYTAKHSEKVVSENCTETCILITVIYGHSITSMIPK